MTGQEIEENTLVNRWVGEYLKEKKKREEVEKALEEIEKVCLEDTRTFADGTQIRYDSLDEILDIINKAKGGEDEE